MPLKSLLGWLHRHWFWVMVVLTATTTLVWSLHYYAQAQAQQAPLHWAAALHKGLFAALQFIFSASITRGNTYDFHGTTGIRRAQSL